MGGKVSSQKENTNKKISWWERFKTMNALQGGDPDTPIFIDYRDMLKADDQEAAKLFEKQNKATSELAIKKGKATVNALAFIGGLKNPFGLLGDLGITTSATLANTALDGNTDNLTKNLATNAMFDVAGKGVADVLGYIGKKAAPHVLRLLPEQMVSALNKGVKEIDYHKLTDQEWDDLYFKALKSGNMDEVQRLRDLHFKVKAPNTKVVDAQGNPAKVYRGQKDASVYKNTNTSKYSDDRTRSGSGYFSTSSPSIADTYARNFRTGAKGEKLNLYLNLENPKVVDAQGRYWQNVELYTAPNGARYGRSTDDIYRNSVKDGNDGVVVKNVSDASVGSKLSETEKIADDYIVTAGRSKLSDPITYDDAGNIIPLSKRDNFLKSDIRYVLFPAAAVGAGFAAQSTEKKQQGGQIKPNFIKRLEDPNRKSIPNWISFKRNPLFNNRGKFTNNYVDDLINAQYPSMSTHKMGYEYTPDDTGRAIVFPEVQEVNGKLVDFTRPPYHPWAGYASALDRGDYLIMKDLEEARKWVESYKDRYKNLK